MKSTLFAPLLTTLSVLWLISSTSLAFHNLAHPSRLDRVRTRTSIVAPYHNNDNNHIISNHHVLLGLGNTKSPPPFPPWKGVTKNYGEESRKYRRTVYTHDDWRKHRHPNRYFHNISTMVTSGVYKTILKYVGTTTLVATVVCLWNTILFGGFVDFTGSLHPPLFGNGRFGKLGLPLAPFTLSSPSLG